MEHLLNYFQKEIIHVNQKKKLNQNHINKIRFIYTFAIIFVFLLFCTFFNIV